MTFCYDSHGIVRVQGHSQAEPVNPVLKQFTEFTAMTEELETLWRSLPLKGKSPQQQAELLNKAAADSLHYVPGVTGLATTAGQALALCSGQTAEETRESLESAGFSVLLQQNFDKAADDQKLIGLRESADDRTDERASQNHERRFLRTELHDDGCGNERQDEPDVAVQRHQRAERTGVDAQRRQHE